MKFKDENGIEIDCSVEEYLVFLALKKTKNNEKNKEVEEKPKFIFVNKPQSNKQSHGIKGRRGYFTWTDEELRTLRENAFESYDKLQELIPNKTFDAIKCKMSNLQLRKNYPKPPRIIGDSRMNGYRGWSKEEEKFLKENIGDCKNSKFLTKKFNKIFPKRSVNSVYQHVKQMGLSFRENSLYGKSGKLKERRDSSVRVEKAKSRLKTIHENARRYVNSYGWSYEKARNQAIQDWSNHAGLGKSSLFKKPLVIETRPVPPVKTAEMKFWFPITEENHDVFEAVIKNLVMTPPHKLELSDINWLRLKNGYSWNFESWNDFLGWFIYNSDDICKYLKISNKFKVENDYLIYEQ